MARRYHPVEPNPLLKDVLGAMDRPDPCHYCPDCGKRQPFCGLCPDCREQDPLYADLPSYPAWLVDWLDDL